MSTTKAQSATRIETKDTSAAGVEAASERITAEVTSWPGVEAGIGKRGEYGFSVDGRQIGHLHGDRVAHFGFPRELGAELREAGRVGPHPVNRHSPKMAARAIADEADLREVIALMRINYDRVRPEGDGSEQGESEAEGSRSEATTAPAAALENPLPGLYAAAPEPLPFARKLSVRSFLLQREQGNLLIYSSPGLEAQHDAIERLGDASRWYLNHGHEAMFAPHRAPAPLFVHEADREPVEQRLHVRASFSRRHTLDDDFEVIPIPGHTPGATAYLWDSGEQRMLFTGDSLLLDGNEWRVAMLDSSDRAAYVESLELIAGLDFDVLVPWAASDDGPYYALTDGADARQRIRAIIDRLWSEGASSSGDGETGD